MQTNVIVVDSSRMLFRQEKNELEEAVVIYALCLVSRFRFKADVH